MPTQSRGHGTRSDVFRWGRHVGLTARRSPRRRLRASDPGGRSRGLAAALGRGLGAGHARTNIRQLRALPGSNWPANQKSEMGAMPTALRGHDWHSDKSGPNSHRQGFSVNPQWTFAQSREVGRARPVPVLGFFAQTATNRILMEVLDLPVDRSRFDDVAIVTAATLPESVVRRAVWLPVFHLSQKTGCCLPH